MAIASSSVRNQGWYLPFSWGPEELPEGQREIGEKSDVSILVHTTADETCALSKDIS